jgi:NAD(P)-dependent dehydrogenase (short-subunit alcohol dehydrogenase family)
VCALTRQLALELAIGGVTVNCVAPGPISTPMTRDFYTPETRSAYESMIPMRRLGTVDEVAHAIAFLVSDNASYVNGITLVVDGGYLAAGVGTTGTLHV